MENLRKLYAVLDRWKGNYLFAGLLMLLAIFVRMLEPRILQIAIDGVVLYGEKPMQQTLAQADVVAKMLYGLLPDITASNRIYVLLCIGLLFVCIATCKSIASFAGSVVAAKSTESAIKNLRDKLLAHIQSLPMAHFSKVPSADMIQRCTGDIDTIRGFIGQQTIEFIRLTGIFVLAFGMMASIHFWYAVISVALVPIVLVLAFYFFHLESKIWQIHEKEQDKLTAIIQENLSGIRVVQAFAKEEYEINKFVNQNIAKRTIGVRHVDYHKVFWSWTDLLLNIQIVLSLFAGTYFVLNYQISLGEFAGFFTYAAMVTFPIRGVGRIVTQMGMAAVGIERIYQILETKPEDYSGKSLEGTTVKGKIEFQDIVFSYDESNTSKTLDRVSFTVNPGEKVAILGPSGSGKSTLITLLGRFYEPTSGQILLDGKPITTLEKTALRKKLGIVHQKSFLFSNSVQGNIAYIKPNASQEKIDEMARAAKVFDFLDKLPDGYKTQVGEKGVTLSGGQKQRVSLARTLLGEPDILILDDSTSAVDTETEFEIQQALKEKMKGKTTLIIAHRLTSIQQADRVIVLDKGKIIEEGTPKELLQKEGFYRKIHAVQISLEDDIENELEGLSKNKTKKN